MAKQTNIKNSTPDKSNANTKSWTGYVPYIVAIMVLIAYGFFISFLIGKVGAKDPDWSRLIYLFSGVEAIVFTAAGFLFGREVNRRRAENAEAEKEQVNKQKEEAQTQAVEERKKALVLGAMAIQGERSSSGTTGSRTAMEGMESKQSSWGSLAETARKMYPELKDI